MTTDDTQIADEIRALWAIPGMNDPAWVNAELRKLGWEPFRAGQHLDPEDPVELTLLANVNRWAILGGIDPQPSSTVTAAVVNRGRLVAHLYDTQRRRP